MLTPGLLANDFWEGSRGAPELPQGTKTVRSSFHQLMECFGVVAVWGRISKIICRLHQLRPWEVGANSTLQPSSRVILFRRREAGHGITMATQQSQPQSLSGISAICANWIASPKGQHSYTLILSPLTFPHSNQKGKRGPFYSTHARDPQRCSAGMPPSEGAQQR